MIGQTVAQALRRQLSWASCELLIIMSLQVVFVPHADRTISVHDGFTAFATIEILNSFVEEIQLWQEEISDDVAACLAGQSMHADRHGAIARYAIQIEADVVGLVVEWRIDPVQFDLSEDQ